MRNRNNVKFTILSHITTLNMKFTINVPQKNQKNKTILIIIKLYEFQRGSDELLSQAAVMAPASDNNNQDLATKKAKLETNTVLSGGVGKFNKTIINIK